jgi:hypothetical protein
MRTISYKNNEIKLQDNTLYFNGEAVKTIENRKYTYKLNKTSISAEGNAAGLYDFIEDCIASSFGLVWVDQIVTHMETLTR